MNNIINRWKLVNAKLTQINLLLTYYLQKNIFNFKNI